MKIIKRMIVIFLLIIPVLVTASTFNVEKNNVNNYMTRSNFKSTYRRYIMNKDSNEDKGKLMFYMDDNGKLSNKVDSKNINAGFTDGGFISRREYLLTVPENGTSYLYDGSTYWTLTCNNESKKCFVIEYTGALDQSGISEYLNYTTSPNIKSKATEFVKKDTKVTGTGKKSDPWIFVPKYKVKIRVSDGNKAKIKDGSKLVDEIDNIYLSGRCTGEGCSETVELILNEGYKYLSNDCDGSYNETTKKFTVSNISKDIVCTINVGTGKFKVTLGDKSYDLKKDIYLRHKENFYRDSGYTNILYDIKSLNDGNLPYRYGYKFLGYFISESNAKIIDETGKVVDKASVNKDKTLLVSKWEALKVNINFNANGGNIISGSNRITLSFNEKYTGFPNVSKTGYTLNGWYTEANGGTKVTSDISINTVDEHTLYAHWTPRVYTVTLNNQSATSAGTKTIYMKYNTGWYSNSGATTSLSKITAPTKNGFTFAGYYTLASGGTQIINASGTILSGKTTIFTSTDNKGTLYAHWTPRTYTVTLNNQSATSAGTTTIYMKYNTGWYSNSAATTALSKITVPTKTGQSFLGYYTAASGGTQIINASGTILSGKTTIFTSTDNKGTLYAHWTPRVYTVTLNNQSATSAGTKTIYMKYNTGWYSNSGATTALSKITVPTKTGHNFLGYYTTASGGTQIINASGTILSGKTTIFNDDSNKGTLYAHWKAICKDNEYLYEGKCHALAKQWTTPGNYNYKIPKSGYYKLETWGAEGAYGNWKQNAFRPGGYGGYTGGEMYLNEGATLYIYVGGKGSRGSGRTGGIGGYNGGANGGNGIDGTDDINPGGGGGGASDIRLNGTNYNNRIIVAGGGGGAAGGGNEVPMGLPGNLYSGSYNSSNSLGVGQNGNNASGGGGGGGGGYYGGMSKSNHSRSYQQGNGGTYYFSTNLVNIVIQPGVKSNNGMVKVSYIGTNPTTSNKNITYSTPGIYSYIVPANGYYNLEVWGAEGGVGLWNGNYSHAGGYGGYTKGKIYLSKNTLLFIYVGGRGGDGYGRNGGEEGFNGGSKGGFGPDTEGTNIKTVQNANPGGGGGGASDIRINGMNYDNRIIIAGGGSGGTGGGGEAPNGLPGNKYSGSTNSSGYLGVGQLGYSTSGGSGGGGGGFYGGKSEQRNVGQGYGGTYYIWNYFSNTQVGVGYKSGNGQVKITFVQ